MINQSHLTKTSELTSTRRSWTQRTYFFLLVIFLLCGLFFPTIDLSVGMYPSGFYDVAVFGRAPVWLAYACVVVTEYWALTLPIIACHLVGSALLALLCSRFLASKQSDELGS